MNQLIALFNAGRHAEVEGQARVLLAQHPDSGFLWNILAGSLHIQGKENLPALQKAAELLPGDAIVQCNLGYVLKNQGLLTHAAKSFRRALMINPDDAAVLCTLGSILNALGQFGGAKTSNNQTLKIKPNHAEANTNLGAIPPDLRRYDDALSCLHRALAIKPDFAEAHMHLGITLKELGQFDEAISSYRQALAIKPDLTDAHLNLGVIYSKQSYFSFAKDCYRKAHQLGAKGALVLESFTLPTIIGTRDEMLESRQTFEQNLDKLIATKEVVDDPLKLIGVTNFILAYQGLNDRDLQIKVAKFYGQACPSLLYNAPNVGDKPPSQRLRLGVCSKYLHNHTIGRLTQGLIEKIDRSLFEVIVIHSALDKIDHISQSIDQIADLAVRIPENLPAARERIVALELDILFYPDIGMAPLTYYLPFARLAPVQAAGWGHPVTTGIPNVDYFLSSRLIEPENAQEHYSEKLVEFENLPSYYFRPLPVKNLTRAELNLPADVKLYVCPQSLFKFHPDFDSMLGELLRRDPEGRLILISGESINWDALLHARFTKAFPDVINRAVFIPRLPTEKFIALLAAADAVLDPPFFGGGNTSYESFSVGAPIVTWPGPFMRGRVTSGCYQSMGFTDLIAHNNEEYISLALRLAHDGEFHNYCKNEILRRSEVLYENSESVKEMEDFFRHAVALATEKQQTNRETT